MGQMIQMPLSFFLEEEPNGSLALSNLISKVDEASKLLTPGVEIELDNGVRCSTRDELFFAVSQAKSNNKEIANNCPAHHVDSTSQVQVKSSSSNVALWTILVILVIFIVLFIMFLSSF